MPSTRHEFLVDLFRGSPPLLATLLAGQDRPPLPSYSSIEALEGALSDAATELRADLVLLFRRGAAPVYAVVLEVQLGRDEDKRWVWPGYVALARARHRCPVSLVVLALEQPVATWAQRPISDEVVGGMSLTPLVLGPGDFPLPPPEAVPQAPELAVLALLARLSSPDLLPSVTATLPGFAALPEEQQRLYTSIVFALLREACHKGFLEKRLMAQLQEKFRATLNSLYEDGRQDGLEEGVEKGVNKGRWLGVAETILGLLEDRGLKVPDQVRERVMACKDPEQIKRMRRAALFVHHAADIFDWR